MRMPTGVTKFKSGKILKTYILTQPNLQVQVMSVKCEQDWDELTVQSLVTGWPP